MSLSSATITMSLADMLGTDFDTRRTKVWVSTNVADETVIDTAGNAIRVGTGTATLASDGTASLSVWVPGSGSNPTTWQTSVHVDYPDAGTRTRKVRTFGPFTITTSADLADLVAEQEVPPEYSSVLIDQIKALLAEAVDLTNATGYVFQGPVDPATFIPSGTEYVWNKTDGAGTLIDIVSGVA